HGLATTHGGEPGGAQPPRLTATHGGSWEPAGWPVRRGAGVPGLWPPRRFRPAVQSAPRATRPRAGGCGGILPGTGSARASGRAPRSEPSVIGAPSLSLRGPESRRPRLPRRDVTAGGSADGIFGSKRSKGRPFRFRRGIHHCVTAGDAVATTDVAVSV